VVKIRLATTSLYTGAAILYLLPVLGLVLGAFAGVWVSTAYGLSEIFGSIAGAVAGLGIALAVVIVLDRSPRFRRRIMPSITAVLKPAEGMPKMKKAVCCD
jgi:positive regulator of sigma E activity